MKENNAARVLGFRLRQERMRRDWSQEGLCRGICAVSWLSKLEQGKADASPEVLSMLLERLELPPYDDDPALGAAIEAQYERVFSGERASVGTTASLSWSVVNQKVGLNA